MSSSSETSPAKASSELLAITKAYDLLRELTERVNQYLRAHKFVLGDRMLHTMHDVFERLLEATRERLEKASVWSGTVAGTMTTPTTSGAPSATTTTPRTGTTTTGSVWPVVRRRSPGAHPAHPERARELQGLFLVREGRIPNRGGAAGSPQGLTLFVRPSVSPSPQP